MAPGRKKGTAKTGGRRKGTPNKVTVAVREAALQHGPAAVAELARLMTEGQSEQVRIAACREMLDRAYGKARQSLEHTGHDSGPIVVKDIGAKERMRRMALFLLEDQGSGTVIEHDGVMNGAGEVSHPTTHTEVDD